MSTTAYRLYIGTYTHGESEGIYQAALAEGTLRIAGSTRADSPSYLAAHRGMLYAVRETHDGGVASYHIGAEGALALTGAEPVQGDAPCHLCVDEGALYVSNYLSGTLSVLALDAQGGVTTPLRQIAHQGHGPNAQRQEGPHVHQSAMSPDGTALAVCDLGIDAVVFYPRSAVGIAQPGESVATPAGAGPRHALFGKGKVWYVICELSCQVLVYEGYGRQAWLRQALSALRGDGQGSSGAALRLSPDGSLLLASIRGENTLVLFRVDGNGALSAPQIIDCGGDWPRDAAFSPDGRHVLCACEHSNQVTLFAVADGALAPLGSTACPTPTCLCFA